MKHTKDTHVVYIITKLELGGAQKVCLSLFNGLHNAGIKSSLMSGTDGQMANEVTTSPNFISLDSLTRKVSILGIFNEVRCFFTLIKKLRTLRTNNPHLIVHTHSTKAGLLGRWAAFFAGVKYRIHTIHGYAFHAHQNWISWLIIYALELMTSFITTHFVCVSSYDVKQGIRLFPRFIHKHSIIRAAIDWQPFYQPARKLAHIDEDQSTFIFGTVACFKPQKNIFDLLQAFEYVYMTTSHIRLEIIGDGYLRADIVAWIKKHNLTHAITLHGWQKQVAPIMANWHAFTLSSLWEGLPCAIIEARLLKLPVICYNTGGIHDVITHGENGLLYKPKDWLGLASGMERVVQDHALYSGLKSYSDQLEDFKISHMVKQHIALYQHL